MIATSSASCKRPSEQSSLADADTNTIGHSLGIGSTEFNLILPSALATWRADQQPTTGCIKVNEPDIRIGGMRNGAINDSSSTSYSYDWIRTDLTASASMKAKVLGFKVASASVDVGFMAGTINNKISYNAISEFSETFGTAYLPTYEFTDEVRTLVDALNAAGHELQTASAQHKARAEKKYLAALIPFYLRCGDRFVYQAVLGTKFSSNFRVNFSSAEALLDYTVNASAEVAGFKKNQSEGSHYDRHVTNSVVEIDVKQEGGDPAAFRSLRERLGLGVNAETASPSTVARCMISPLRGFMEDDGFRAYVEQQLNPCFATVDHVKKYLREDYYKQISSGHILNTFVPQSEKTIGYYEAGLLDVPVTLPDDLRTSLALLDNLFKHYYWLNTVSTNISQMLGRALQAAGSAAGIPSSINIPGTDLAFDWAPLRDKLAQFAFNNDNSPTHKDMTCLRRLIASCMNSIEQWPNRGNCLTNLDLAQCGCGADASACAAKPIDISKYRDFYFIEGDSL